MGAGAQCIVHDTVSPVKRSPSDLRFGVGTGVRTGILGTGGEGARVSGEEGLLGEELAEVGRERIDPDAFRGEGANVGRVELPPPVSPGPRR